MAKEFIIKYKVLANSGEGLSHSQPLKVFLGLPNRDKRAEVGLGQHWPQHRSS